MPARHEVNLVFDLGKPVIGVNEDGVLARLKCLPRLLGGEAEYRGHEAKQAPGDVVERVLRRAPRGRIRGARIQAVLEDVEVERAEVLRAERLQPRDRGMELELLAVGEDRGLQLGGERGRIAVDLQPILDRHRVPLRIEVRGVREQEPQRIADAPVAFHHSFQDLIRDRQLARIVRRRDPQAQDLRAERSGYLLRLDRVALRLAHLAAFPVDEESVSQKAPVRRHAVQHARNQERRVEPAAVLVGPLQVQVGGKLQLPAVRAGAGFLPVGSAHHGLVSGARVEPYVQRVLHLDVLLRLGAQQLPGIEGLPRLDPRLLDPLRHALDQLERARMQLARLPVDEERHRHAPLALARQRPVGAVGDHSVQARLPPRGEKARRFDAAERGGAQRLRRFRAVEPRRLVHGDEPLLAGAIDDRRLVAPAVHVAVLDSRVAEQVARLSDLLDDLRVRLPDVHAAEQRQRRIVFPVAHHRREDLAVLHAVAPAGLEVLHAICRRRMHDAGAGIERDVFAEVDRRAPLVEGMLEATVLQRLTFARGERLPGQLVAREALLLELGGEDEQAFRGVDQVVDQVGMYVQRLVARQRPGGRGPDDRESWAVHFHAEGARQLIGLGKREADIDRRVLAVLVLDLGLGERRAAVEAPVHRLQAAVDIPLREELRERPDLVGLAPVRHGREGVVPVAEHAQALEILLLPLDLLGGVGAAQALRLLHRQALPVALFDLALDRHAVTVPARHVHRVESRHVARLDDDVLEDLVDRVAEMDIAVRVGRAVVQDEFRPAAARLADPPIDVPLLPFLYPMRFAPGQIAAHRKGRVRKIQGFLVIGLVLRHRGDPEGSSSRPRSRARSGP